MDSGNLLGGSWGLVSKVISTLIGVVGTLIGVVGTLIGVIGTLIGVISTLIGVISTLIGVIILVTLFVTLVTKSNDPPSIPDAMGSAHATCAAGWCSWRSWRFGRPAVKVLVLKNPKP